MMQSLMWCRCKNKRGFTLLELLVSIATIAIIAALAIPAIQRIHGTAQRIACTSHLGQLHQIMMAYATDHNGTFIAYNPTDIPDSTNEYNNWPWHLYRSGYINGWDLFRCPAAPKAWGCSGIFSHYAYNGWLPPATPENLQPDWCWGRLSQVAHPASVIMLIDGAYPDGMHPLFGYYFFSDPVVTAHPRHQGLLNILYVDGHVSASRNEASTFEGRVKREN